MKDLRALEKDKLIEKLNEFKKELSTLRVAQRVSGTAAKVGKIGPMRKNVARVLTVLNQKERENLTKLYAKEKFTPKNLRLKLTKARRQQLSHREQARKTKRQIRKAALLPLRRFAVKQ